MTHLPREKEERRPASPSVFPEDSAAIDRRAFLARVGAGAAALSIPGGALSLPPPAGPDSPENLRTSRLRKRRAEALHYRVRMAKRAQRRNFPLVSLENNGEEEDFPTRIANYSKGLPHDALGEVDPAAYDALLAAVRSGEPSLFDAVPLAGTRKLTSPQAGLAFDLEGPDSHSLALRPAPRIDGPENSSEMAELYWMALARDVPFGAYASDPTIGSACADLSGFSDFRGPKVGGQVTAETLFRGSAPGDSVGPYLSQFLLEDIPYGALIIPHRIRTLLPGLDHLTSYGAWLDVQNGARPTGDAFDATPRYIRNLRDLAQYVHVDALYEAYLNACLILLGRNAPLDPGLPPVSSPNQIGFAEFGGPHLLSLVTEVATRALKAVWCQKWLVHRRLRPEEFGGRVHQHLTGAAQYPIHGEILRSAALSAVFAAHGSYLLPQAYPDGCPTHPAYGAGHATVAGACVTILKAFFDESFVLPDPVVPSADGTSLLPFSGPPLTVGNELDKLAANIAFGRNAAGIHWRTDYSESVRLGEEVAIGILEEQKEAHNQPFAVTLTRFDGSRVAI
ncbi:MAG TPA: vanadium-dependent haloperoxidase [Planctomycetota bacterium]|nr:vanadium-dependent haloperoxidase [Planctomycetota bacterium]